MGHRQGPVLSCGRAAWPRKRLEDDVLRQKLGMVEKPINRKRLRAAKTVDQRSANTWAESAKLRVARPSGRSTLMHWTSRACEASDAKRR